VNDALKAVGRYDTSRARIIAALRHYERLSGHRFTTVRDGVTGPIVDALHGSIIADALRGRGTCHAFEAGVHQAAMLERNAVLNGPANMRVNITPNVSPKLLLHRDPKLHHPRGGL
jgi:hypothetical protein